MAAHQGRRTLAQFRRSGRGRRQFAQLIRFGSHETNVKTILAHGKESLFRPWRQASARGSKSDEE
jgi:hypothetical protein